MTNPEAPDRVIATSDEINALLAKWTDELRRTRPLLHLALSRSHFGRRKLTAPDDTPWRTIDVHEPIMPCSACGRPQVWTDALRTAFEAAAEQYVAMLHELSCRHGANVPCEVYHLGNQPLAYLLDVPLCAGDKTVSVTSYLAVVPVKP